MPEHLLVKQYRIQKWVTVVIASYTCNTFKIMKAYMRACRLIRLYPWNQRFKIKNIILGVTWSLQYYFNLKSYSESFYSKPVRVQSLWTLIALHIQTTINNKTEIMNSLQQRECTNYYQGSHEGNIRQNVHNFWRGNQLEFNFY